MTKTAENILLFLMFLIAGGIYCALIQQEIWWDFFNYHYYNGWAFWTGQTFKNIAPAGAHSYFNPLLDLYTYFLVSHFNESSHLIYFGQGLWLGALWFITLKLILLILPNQTKLEKMACLIAFFFSILSYSIFRQAGTSTNEIPVAVLFLSGCYWLLKYLYQTDQRSKPLLMGSGLIIGMTCGLKMTVIPMAVALGLFLLFYYRHLKSPIKTYLLWGFSGIIGYLITNGFWMFLLWSHFKNPFFPFFNNIFKSPFALPVYIRDKFYDPPDIWGYFSLPWDLMNYNFTASDTRKQSFNIPLGLLAAVFSLFLKNKKPVHNFLIAFILLSYPLWLLSTHVLRYAIPLEIFSSIICVALIIRLQRNFAPAFLIALLLLNTWAAFTYRYWLPFHLDDKAYIRISAPKIASDTVILLYGQRVSGLLPHIQGGQIAAGIETMWRLSQPETNISVTGHLNSLLLQKTGKNPLYALMYMGYPHPACSEIKNFSTPYAFYVCPKPDSDGIVHGMTLEQLGEFLR